MEGDEGMGCVANMARSVAGLEIGDWREMVPRYGFRKVLWFCRVRRFDSFFLDL